MFRNDDGIVKTVVMLWKPTGKWWQRRIKKKMAWCNRKRSGKDRSKRLDKFNLE